MVSATIDNALVTQFSDMLHLEAAQKFSKSSPYLKFVTLQGDDFAYDSFGNVAAQKIDGRSQPVQFSEVDFGRRKLTRERYTVPVPMDESDVNAMLRSPESAIIPACIASLNRVKDRIVVRQALADVKTGREFGTTLTFAQDNGLTVDATAGLTFEKLLEIRRNFKKRNVDIRNVALMISEKEEEALLLETELTNNDYVDGKPINQGDMIRALGMDLVVFGSDPVNDNPILSASGGTRDCIALAVTPDTSGIVMGLSRDISVKVENRPDLIDTVQVVVTMEVGAVRTEGTLIQKVQTTI